MSLSRGMRWTLLIALVLGPLAGPLGMPLGTIAPASADPAPISALAPAAREASFAGAPGGTSLILLEGSTGQVIAARDAERRRPIASAIKLVTALAVVEALPAGSVVVVGQEAVGIEGSSYGLRVGDVRSVEDLLVGLLLRSGNDAAVVLAHAVSGGEEAFVLRMQDVLERLGIDAKPSSSSGLTDGDVLSAAELGIVSRAALAEPRIRAIVAAPVVEVDGSLVENRNLFVVQFEGATGLKTGFTSAAGYTLSASAQRGGRELVAIVLGAPDDATRRTVASRLLEFGFGETRLVPVERSVTLRTSRGPVRFSTEGTLVTLTVGQEPVPAWPIALRPDDPVSSVQVSIDGRVAGPANVVRRDARSEGVVPALGPALADGVYSALRPFGIAGTLR
jgi:serine-type D-Ala-D-Ala carboxypeptidase (penicillin-binding protein 5/6)